MSERKWYDPEQVVEEYKTGIEFKTALGRRGLYEQSKMNERFFVGDQWNGVQCGDDKPLIQHNVIKRIGDYKMAMIGAAPISVNYSADGVPCTAQNREKIRNEMERLARGEQPDKSLSDTEKITLVMGAMSDYFRVTAERVKFDDKKNAVLRNAYISGTGILYTYWDGELMTGLYATEDRKTPIKGDIQCEVLDVENVYFGDPNVDDVQSQPFIILAQRRRVEDIKREMRQSRRTSKNAGEVKAQDVDNITADLEKEYQAGDRADNEPANAQKAIVLTKLYKEYDDKTGDYKVMAVKVCGKVTVRHAWDTKLRLYPLAKVNWETRHNCAYGDSEITNIIANQIAINRAHTAAVWSTMMHGLPIMLVDGDTVQQQVTNEPGQVVTVYGDNKNPIAFVQPPQFTPQFTNLIEHLIGNTLAQSGANDAALGDVNPDNTSAIVAAREAATMPLQIIQNRFYSFIEDVARIWAGFWVQMYGKRSLHIRDKSGDWYLPFDGAEYQNLLINARIDVGAAGIWNEVQSIQTLDGLLGAQVITPLQYLERLPKGVVEDVDGLIRELQQAATIPSAPVPTNDGGNVPPAGMEMPPEEVPAVPEENPSISQMLAMLPPESQKQFAQLTPEQQREALALADGAMM